MTFTLVLTLLLAVLIGVSLGLLGGGGSILTVPILTYVAGLPPKRRSPPRCSSSGPPRQSAPSATPALAGCGGAPG